MTHSLPFFHCCLLIPPFMAMPGFSSILISHCPCNPHLIQSQNCWITILVRPGHSSDSFHFIFLFSPSISQLSTSILDSFAHSISGLSRQRLYLYLWRFLFILLWLSSSFWIPGVTLNTPLLQQFIVLPFMLLLVCREVRSIHVRPEFRLQDFRVELSGWLSGFLSFKLWVLPSLSLSFKDIRELLFTRWSRRLYPISAPCGNGW